MIMFIELSSFSWRSFLANSATAHAFGLCIVPKYTYGTSNWKYSRSFLAEARLSARSGWSRIVAALLFTVALAVVGVPTGYANELETVKPIFQHAIPNIPGKNLVALVVNYAPGGKSLPHRHAKSAFVYAYVLAGAIRSRVDDAPAKVYRIGEGFHEEPGAHHRVSENASDTQPASLLAVFIVDAEDHPLTTAD
jgi:quercetin dioxygenase-like cupin family protein